ncbi:TAXI family TRAP transporter solute-binding subunit [Lentibacillus halophilus]|uniref:TAXI family TRAP transporter solute-binding subunit n=1 Tax=Lentibacillus halophilus TaxID=295065 RepID=A0ABN0ZHY1_9BACI
MNKKMSLLALILIVMSVFLFGCNEESSSSSTQDIELSTATTTGNFYPFGSALANVWNDNVSGVRVASQSSDGSVQNINLMKKGNINMGLSTLGVLYNAYHGKGQFDGRKSEDIRAVSTLFTDAAQVIVTKDSGIDSVEEIDGKSFVPGAPQSGTKDLAEIIFNSYDMTFEDMKAEFVGFSQASDLLRNGKIDGAHVMSALPTSATIEILSSTDSKILSLSDEAINKATEENSWLIEQTIPSDTYDQLDRDISTVAQPSVLFVSKDMSEDLIYELTKTMWENLKVLRDTIDAAKNMKIEGATSGVADIPLHPGAKKYYKEQGVLEE